MKPIKLSVRKIVEFVLRGGDIDSRFVDADAMYEGAKAHRRIQGTMGANYQKEAALSIKFELDGASVVIHGRADGIIDEPDGGITIDEIKTTTMPLSRMYEQREMHMSQAKCYAHMLLESLEAPPSGITVQLTYCQLETEQIERHRWFYSAEELSGFFHSLMERYGLWLRFEREWKLLRDKTIKAAAFPFETYRKGQREMAVAVYRTIERQSKLYVQAPTGIGKTLSAMYPSIKAIAEEKAEKLFYLTAKTVTRAVAQDALRLMLADGLRFKCLTMRAKDKICFCEKTVCNPEFCEYARGHFDRVNDALMDMLEHNDLITPEVVEEYAKRHRVCPHELALDAATWTDIVVCDYNHVFDPTVYLRRFFGEAGGDYVFLIDEAHNLADRVRDMYTVSLSKSAFYRLKKELKDQSAVTKKLNRAMGSVNKHFVAVRKACAEQTSVSCAEQDVKLRELVEIFSFAAQEWLTCESDSHPLHHDLLELYFEAQSYLLVADLYDERFAYITELFGSDVAVTLFCLDPSELIGDALGRAKASVLFSATLTPLAYYRDILGGTQEDKLLSLPSPFEQGRLLLAAHCGISTKYAQRPNSLEPIAEAVESLISKRQGNYIVYFPSYEYMKNVYEVFSSRNPGVHTIVQQSGMDEQERERFLLQFDADNSETLVGFCVLGGIFSEGIDLKGERLIGTVIVGVGLPKLSLRQDLIRDYYDRQGLQSGGDGYDYAYVYPGMNKVLQAAGRVIRSESDYGAVLLIDKRFNTPKYRSLYPQHWLHMRMIPDTMQLDALIAAFPYF